MCLAHQNLAASLPTWTCFYVASTKYSSGLSQKCYWSQMSARGYSCFANSSSWPHSECIRDLFCVIIILNFCLAEQFILILWSYLYLIFSKFHFSISSTNSLTTSPFILFMHSDVINLSHCASCVDQFELLHTC